MNEFEECLYDHIMDNKFHALRHDPDYANLEDIRESAEKTLMGALTEKQRALFHQYLEGESAVYSMELRYLFDQAFSLGIRIARL